MTKKIKILFLAAHSLRESPNWFQQEIREIEARMQLAEHRDAFEAHSHLAVRISDLQRILLKHQPHIVHFSGRGTKNQGIILEDDAGQPLTINEKALTSLFRTLKDNIRVIVFNACYTNRQAAALAEIVDYAIGINRSVEADTAVTFSAFFYQALAFGRTVKEAFDLAITQLMLERTEEYRRPFLKIRSGVDPSQIIWNGKKEWRGGLPQPISAGLRQRCLELFSLFDELRTPDDLRNFASTEELIRVRKCIPNSTVMNHDQLINNLLKTGRSVLEPALFDLLNGLADRYEDDYKGQLCERLKADISKEIT